MDDKHEKDLNKLLVWARYLYWADLLRRNFIDYQNGSDTSDNAADGWHLFAVASQWLASMWVVIEGWRELRLEDKIIDHLLNNQPDYCNLLRRYRNGVFHYQPKFIDERCSTFLDKGERPLLWVFALYLEFQRFLWEWPERFKGTREEIQEIREIFVEIIGWMPTDIIPTYKRILADHCQEALDEVKFSGDTNSEAAKDLLEAVAHAQRIVKDIPDTPFLDYLNI